MRLNTHTGTRSKWRSGRAWFVLLAFAAMIVLAACGGSTSGGSTPTPTQAGNTPTTGTTAKPSGPTKAIAIDTSTGSFGFNPTTITITVGTTVTWTNTTGAPHTVTSDDGKTFDSGINTPISANGGTFSFTFTKAGTFAYHCQIHPFMKATIIVQ
ncbi:MAG: hypothetical protein NVSMB27_24330 [Ktedonobacteraceae bacterium]